MTGNTVLLRQADSQEGLAIISAAITSTIEALGLNSATFGKDLISAASQEIWVGQVQFLVQDNGYLSSESTLFDFEEKARTNLSWLKAYGVTGADWAAAAVKQPPLFSQKPDTLQTNFESNLSWLKAYGVTGADWATAAVKHPSLFNQKPDTLQTNFELLMIVCESPAYKPRDKDCKFRETRVAVIMAKPFVLCLAEDNLLLRLAFAEITQPKASASLLNDTRGNIEQKLVQALGFNPTQKRILNNDGNSERASLTTTTNYIKSAMRDHAERLRADWRAKPAATRPREAAFPILPIFLPMGDQELTSQNKALLLKRMIMGGLRAMAESGVWAGLR